MANVGKYIYHTWIPWDLTPLNKVFGYNGIFWQVLGYIIFSLSTGVDLAKDLQGTLAWLSDINNHTQENYPPGN